VRPLSLAPLVVAVLVLLVAGCGADAGRGEGPSGPSTPPPANPPPSRTPFSSVPPPGPAAPVPPSTPSDLVRPRTESGRVLRTGGCTYLVTELARLPLRGSLVRELPDAAEVTLLVRPLPQLNDPCGDGVVQVVEIRR
jgi:hypothetical protein